MNMNNQKPKISVVMSVYNGDKYLKEAIESILSQTFTDLELIIINDGSTDRSREILESYKDGRIRLFNNTNKGLTKSLNEGIRYSNGEYIARMDADDVSMPNRFERQVSFLDSHPGIVMCGTWAQFTDKDGNDNGPYQTPVSGREIRTMLIKHSPFIHPSVMIRRNLFDKVGFYDESFRCAQDYELWTRVVALFDTANLPEVLLKYRVLKSGITGSNRLKVKIAGLKIRWLGIWRLLLGYFKRMFF
jgi:glycosyltransferase involved in cell wall biosynthesis